MSRFWSSPVSSRGCPGTALCALLAAARASLVKVVLARVGRPSRAAFPVAGAKADAGWNGFLWPVGRARRQRVADARHAGVLAASFHTCRGAHAAVPPGIARFSRSSGLCCRLPESWAASLAQECVQRSVISLRGAFVHSRREFESNPITCPRPAAAIRDTYARTPGAPQERWRWSRADGRRCGPALC